MRCWTCSQPVVAKHLCYRLPQGRVHWLYGCVGCRTTYLAWYAHVTGPLGRPGLLHVQAVAPTNHQTILIGELVRDARDPIAEAETTGDVILRTPT